MIKKLRIRNFKGWQDTGQISMAPLTVFFGANSSGKSSISHLLLALKQTVENSDRKTVIFPGGNNSPLQFGSLQNLIYHRNTENKVEFEYLWDLAEPFSITEAKSKKEYHGNALCFSATIGINNQKTSEVDRFRYDLLAGGDTALSIGMSKSSSKSSYTMMAENYKLLKNTGRPWGIGQPVRFYGFPETAIAYYQNADFVQTFNLRHEQLFGSIYYLGPLRNSPARHYPWSGSEPGSVGYSGEYTIDAILAAQNRMLNMRKRLHKRPFQEIIARQLKVLGLTEHFALEQMAGGQQLYGVKVRTNASEDTVDLPDVGFGVSQVLPVLVQLFYAPINSIIIMEQPELHLHPRAQAALADVMIDAIMSGEEGKERGIQLIIETHSEHFLRRLQRRIADDTISNDHIAVYFANSNVKPAVLEALQVDLFGNISNWPKDFFGDEMGDIAAQHLAAMKKRAKETGQ